MLSDPISDFLSRIRNGYLASKKEVEIPYSKLKEEMSKILKDYSFIKDYSVAKRDKKKVLLLILLYKDKGNRKPAISKIQRVSKPGLRKYSGAAKLKPILGGFGISIVSTSQGVMSNLSAKKKNLGGEVLALIY